MKLFFLSCIFLRLVFSDEIKSHLILINSIGEKWNTIDSNHIKSLKFDKLTYNEYEPQTAKIIAYTFNSDEKYVCLRFHFSNQYLSAISYNYIFDVNDTLEISPKKRKSEFDLLIKKIFKHEFSAELDFGKTKEGLVLLHNLYSSEKAQSQNKTTLTYTLYLAKEN